jgi:hypothetical protein
VGSFPTASWPSLPVGHSRDSAYCSNNNSRVRSTSVIATHITITKHTFPSTTYLSIIIRTAHNNSTNNSIDSSTNLIVDTSTFYNNNSNNGVKSTITTTKHTSSPATYLSIIICTGSNRTTTNSSDSNANDSNGGSHNFDSDISPRNNNRDGGSIIIHTTATTAPKLYATYSRQEQ